MEISTGNYPEQGDASSHGKNFQTFFTYHLNRIYTAKLRMSEILDELLTDIAFSDLAVAVRATLNLVHGQIAMLKEIYAILAISPSSAEQNELLRLVEEGYLSTGKQQKDTPAFELAVLGFLQSVESLELASFKVLQQAALELDNSFVSQLLDQSVAESEADYKLLLAHMAKHINKS